MMAEFNETTAGQLWSTYVVAREISDYFESRYYKAWRHYKDAPSDDSLLTQNEGRKWFVNARKQEVAKYDEWKRYAFPPYEL